MKRRRAAYFDGRASARCGKSERLELDHIDPALKVTHSIWSWAEARRNEELAKCQVLCQECHLKKTTEDRRKGALFLIHDTDQCYDQGGCRCDLCRATKRIRNARRYRRSL